MIIQTFPSGPFETNAIIVACQATKIGVIIDPAPESSQKIADFLAKNNLHPEKILITHSHWDHIADIAILQSKFDFHIPVLIHEEDAGNLQNPGTDGLPCWVDFEGVKADGFLTDGEIIKIGELSFEVIHTPGHSPGGVCFYNKDRGVLIAGDTLFKGSIGNLSFPTARPKLMWSSLKRLALLPPETAVYPGHGPRTTIGEERWLVNAEMIFGHSV